MPNLNPNSTNYVHTNEPNTNDLVQAMDYNPAGQPVLRIDDTSLQHTSKDRAKVSGYEIVFFNTFQYDKEADVWDELTTTGGSAVHSDVRSEVVLTVDGAQAGSKVVRQTKTVQRYIPGRTAEASFAFRFTDTAAGIRKRIGMFDDQNGLFLEEIGDELAFVIRSNASGSVVDTRITQANWNQNKLDGTAVNGVTLDPTMRQIVIFEYEWYGAGIAEMKFVIDDHPISAHKQFHGNRQELPWMGTPFVPFRCEIENISSTTGTHSLHQSSNSFMLEGNTGLLGVSVSVSSPITGTRLGSANSWYPVLSIRLQPDKLAGVVLPSTYQVATIDNTNIFFRLVRNAVIGADAGNSAWTDVPDTGSAFTEYQTYNTPAAIDDADQGTRLDSGFIVAGGGSANITLDQSTQYQLGRQTTTTIGDTSDVFTLLCASSSTNKDALASMTWVEQR
ncbi:hypothetical protein N9C48_01625 [bacterium]|nr:hypothetical protein [bacterium]